MIYLSIQPSPHLRDYIREYLLVDFVFDKKETVPIKPYPAIPEQGITFYVKGCVVVTDPDTNTFEKRPLTVIFGQPILRQNLRPSNEYIMFNMRFQPGALFKLLRISMTEFLHKNVDAELVLGREIHEVNDQLANAPSYNSMVNIVESYLWKKIQQIKDDVHPIDKIGQVILENPQSFSLDKFAKEACLSASQLERRFLQQVGVHPKFFSRLCRFYQAFKMKEHCPHLNWLTIAWETGYNDYQHLVKDFKEFSGSLPNALIQEDAHSPEQRLGLNPRYD